MTMTATARLHVAWTPTLADLQAFLDRVAASTPQSVPYLSVRAEIMERLRDGETPMDD